MHQEFTMQKAAAVSLLSSFFTAVLLGAVGPHQKPIAWTTLFFATRGSSLTAQPTVQPMLPLRIEPATATGGLIQPDLLRALQLAASADGNVILTVCTRNSDPAHSTVRQPVDLR